MKKIIIIIIFSFFISETFSQANMGFLAGSNFSYYTGDSTSVPLSGLKPGFTGGIFWDISTQYKTYIQIGGLYSSQGAIYKHESFDFGKKVVKIEKFNIGYIKIPLSWKQIWGDWYTTIGGYGQIAVNPKANWIIRKEYTDTIIESSNVLQSFLNDLRTYDAGVNLGIGIQIPLATQYDFFMKASYSHGLFPINQSAIRVEDKIYNRYFTVSFGIIINNNTYKYKSRR